MPQLLKQTRATLVAGTNNIEVQELQQPRAYFVYFKVTKPINSASCHVITIRVLTPEPRHPDSQCKTRSAQSLHINMMCVMLDQ